MPNEHPTPRTTAATERAAAAKRERLAAELRANLGRRKTQERARADGEDAPAGKPSQKDGVPP